MIERKIEEFKTSERYVYGWVDPRAAYGTQITWRYKLRCWWRDTARPHLRAAWRWLTS